MIDETRILKTGSGFWRFSGDTLRFVKKLLPDYGYSTESTDKIILKDNGSLFLLTNNALERYDYDISRKDFVNKRIVFDNQWSYNAVHDRDFRYLSVIVNDSLRVFDVEQEKYIRQYNLSGISRVSTLPFMDPPYVYIHQILSQYTGLDNDRNDIIKDYSLSAYPNPFNSSARISFSLPYDQEIEISVFDMLGRKIKSLVKGLEKKGDHEVMFNAMDLPSGIYFYNLTAESFNKTNKIILLK